MPCRIAAVLVPACWLFLLVAAVSTTAHNSDSWQPPSTPPTPKPSTNYLVYNRGDLIEATNQTCSCFRIPSLVRTHRGTLLAFAEGRIGGCRPDVAANRPLVVRSSANDGLNWTSIRIAVPADPSFGTNYPAATVLADGTVLLTFFKDGGRSTTPPGGAWSTRSTDDGMTWSAPMQMPGSCAAFPAVLLGDNKTLVAPCSSYATISLDDGETWRRSTGNITLGPNVTGLGESTLVADGRAKGNGLSMFIRAGSHSM